ncbi:MAG: tetratricopeptide repeat protein [Rhodocyclaceae bacterium]|nr:tetratricopeptide repeat protein [Rhodocyclaceae bacterium]
MSLLIDALRKAEEQKRRGEPERALGASTPAPGADAAAARKLFEVKTGPRTLSFPVTVALLTTLALIAIGIYFWLQISPPGPRLVVLTPPVLPAQPEPAAALPESAAPPAAAPSRDTVASVAPDPAPASPATPPAAPVRIRRAVPPAPKPAAPARAVAHASPTQTTPAAKPIPVVRGVRQAVVPPTLEAAWQAYQAGELARAAGLYRRVLDTDPRNIDALNGMGAITARAGEREAAADWFRRSLGAKPTDATALAGLSALGAHDPSEASPTGRLKSAVASQPDQAALHFALGNALAAETRWAEAQSSFFRAYGLDKGNPDYLFNLGVSLDQLGKRTLALRFYTEALAAARARPYAFDPAAVEARVASLAEAPAEAPRD